jgi:hypothetical protein
MTWWQTLGGTLISGAAIGAAIAFLMRQFVLAFMERQQDQYRFELQRQLEGVRQGLTLNTATHQLLRQSQIAHKERQLSEFYLPIYAQLRRGRRIVRLGEEGKLGDVDKPFWELAITTNSNIEKIILDKSHLIEGTDFPESFNGLLIHVQLLKWYRDNPGVSRPNKDEVPEAWYSEDFEEDVFKTVEKLRRELNALYDEYGVRSGGQALPPVIPAPT